MVSTDGGSTWSFCIIISTGLGIFIEKKTYLSSISYILQLVVSVIFIYLLAAPYGIVGVAYSFLLGKLALLFLQSFLALQVSNIRFRYWPALAIGCVVFLAAYTINDIV